MDKSKISCIEDIKVAIEWLNSGVPTKIQVANAALLDFMESHDSWMGIINLLSDHDVFVRYFASNMLLTKVKRAWSTLNDVERLQIYEIITTIIREAASLKYFVQEDKIFMNRLALIIIHISCRIPDGPNQLIKSSLALMRPYSNSNLDIISSLSQCSANLHLLSLMPLEVEDMDVSRSLSVEIKEHLHTLLPNVLQELAALLQWCQSQDAGTSGHPPTPTSPSPHHHIGMNVLRVGLLTALQNWMRHGLILSVMSQDYPQLFGYLLWCCHCSNLELMQQGYATLKDLVCVGEYPVSSKRKMAVQQVFNCIVTPNETMSNLFANPSDSSETVANDVCYSICSIADHEAVYISSVLASEPTDGDYSQQKLCHSVLELVVKLTSLKPVKLAIHTFDFWIALQEEAAYSKSSHCLSLSSALLAVLKGQVMYRAWNITRDCDDDCEQVDDFRENSQGLDDLLVILLQRLGSHFYASLSTDLMECVSLSQSSGAASEDWCRLDVIMFILTVTMDTCKASIVRNLSSLRNDLNISIMDHMVDLKLIHQIVSYLVSLNPDSFESMPSLVKKTSCRFVGSCTFLLADTLTASFNTSSTNPVTLEALHMIVQQYTPLFPSALVYILNCVALDPECGRDGAASFLKLCTHGQSLLQLLGESSESLRTGGTGSASDILGHVGAKCVNILVSQVDSHVGATEDSLTLIRAFMAIVAVQRNPECSKYFVWCLADPLQQRLQFYLSGNNFSHGAVVAILKIFATVARHAENHSALHSFKSEGDAVYLHELVNAVWPLLLRILDICSDRAITLYHICQNVLREAFDAIQQFIVRVSSILFRQEMVCVLFERCVFLYGQWQSPPALNTCTVMMQVCGSDACIDSLLSNAFSSIVLAMSDILMIEKSSGENLSSIRECYKIAHGAGVGDHTISSSRISQYIQRVDPWICAPETIESLCDFIEQILVLKRHLVLEVAISVPHIVHNIHQLLLVALNLCVERDAVKAIVKCAVSLFDFKKFQIPQVQVDVRKCFVQPALSASLDYISSIFYVIDGIFESALWTVLADLLNFIILSCMEEMGEQWMQQVLREIIGSNSTLPLIPLDLKSILVDSLIRLAKSSPRRLKTLVVDVGKISAREIEATALQDYLVMII